jgi:hypothetical protein
MNKIPLLIAIAFLFISCQPSSRMSFKNVPLEKGVYDAQIGNDKLVIVIQNASTSMATGFFVLNRGKSIEMEKNITFTFSGNKFQIHSDVFAGKLKGELVDGNFNGQIFHTNKKRILFFWPKKDEVALLMRNTPSISTSQRYQKEIFKEIRIINNLKYGKAKGYWTENPYNNEPYIEVLTKGISGLLKEPDSLNLFLDLYLPSNDNIEKRPLILLIHGGAFYIGTRKCETATTLAKMFARMGYVTASIDYRMGFKLLASDVERSGYRAVQDAHAALRFLSYHSNEYKIDPSQVYVAGTSAGGVASLNVAFLDNNTRPKSIFGTKKSEDLGKIEESGNSFSAPFTIKAVGNMWGAVGDLNIINESKKIPVISFHGNADDIVPYDYDYPFQKAYLMNRLIMNKMYGSKPIHDKLNLYGTRNKLITLEGLKHEPHSEKSGEFNQYMDTIKTNLTDFFYTETAPKVLVPLKQLEISHNSKIQPLYYEIDNGELVQTIIIGGVKATADLKCTEVIWFNHAGDKQITWVTKNKYNAWNSYSAKIQVNSN